MVKISLKVLVVLLSVKWVSEDVETVKERTIDFWCRHAAQPFPALLRWACLLSASKCISLVVPAAALTVSTQHLCKMNSWFWPLIRILAGPVEGLVGPKV